MELQKLSPRLRKECSLINIALDNAVYLILLRVIQKQSLLLEA